MVTQLWLLRSGRTYASKLRSHEWGFFILYLTCKGNLQSTNTSHTLIAHINHQNKRRYLPYCCVSLPWSTSQSNIFNLGHAAQLQDRRPRGAGQERQTEEGHPEAAQVRDRAAEQCQVLPRQAEQVGQRSRSC